MKVIYITNESYLDHSYTIAKVLGKKISFTVYIQAKECTREILNWCSLIGAEFVKRKRYRNPFSLFTEFKFILRIRKQNADIVWFNTITFYQLLLVRMFLKKFIVMVHDVEFHPELKDPFAVFSVRLSFILLKRRLCTASLTQALIYEKEHKSKPLIFRLPVIDYFTDSGITSPSRNRNDNLVRFFFFGSIKRYKGIETLIEAAQILEDKKIKCAVNIYGKFRYEAGELIHKINKLGNINLKDEFIEFDRIHEIYLQNDILILPYKHVTQCGPLLIGYNELVPPIASDLPGFREYIDDGKSGILFNGASELSEKMEMIIRIPAVISEMKEYIKTEIFKRFSMENLCNDYIRNFEQIRK